MLDLVSDGLVPPLNYWERVKVKEKIPVTTACLLPQWGKGLHALLICATHILKSSITNIAYLYSYLLLMYCHRYLSGDCVLSLLHCARP